MRKRRSSILVLMLAACTASAFGYSAHIGEIIWDFGPGTGVYNTSSWNEVGESEWADDVIFPEFMALTGIDIWTLIPEPAGNTQVKVLLNDRFNPLLPGEEYVRFDVEHTSYMFDGNYNGIDLYKVSFDFDPVMLRADTRYWIGVSGNAWNLAQAFIRTPGDGKAAFFRRGEFSHMSTSGDQMFRLRGRAVFPPFEISLDGACPGEMTANVIGATPGGRIAILRGQRGGETILNSGSCAGSAVPLGEARLVGTITPTPRAMLVSSSTSPVDAEPSPLPHSILYPAP